MPHDLHALILAHKRPLLTLLFNAARQTLGQFGQRTLGGQIGCTMVLHTWDQTLGLHCHVHCIMAAGALSAKGTRWIAADPRFLFPVRALSTVLRGKFCAALAQIDSTSAVPRGEGPLTLGTPEDFAQLLAQLYAKDWVVYAKAPLAGPAHVLDYVGRYTHRVALANHRILDVRDGWVRFAYRNRRQGNRVQTITLDADEFIRRFLLHVLPRGFMRIRHDGFLANRHKARSLLRCRDLLGQPPKPPPRRPKSVVQWMHEVTGIDPHTMSALWRETTRAAPAAPPCSTRCPSRGSFGGANLRLVRIPRSFPRLPQRIPSRVPQRPQGDVRLYGGMRSLTGGHVSRFSLARGTSGTLRPCSRLCGSRFCRLWPLSHSALVIQSPYRCPGVRGDGAAAQCNHVLSIMRDTMDKTLFVRHQRRREKKPEEHATSRVYNGYITS